MTSKVLDKKTREILDYKTTSRHSWGSINSFNHEDGVTLEELLLDPQTDINEINNRLDTVGYMIEHEDFANSLDTYVGILRFSKSDDDLERAKYAMKIGYVRDSKDVLKFIQQSLVSRLYGTEYKDREELGKYLEYSRLKRDGKTNLPEIETNMKNLEIDENTPQGVRSLVDKINEFFSNEKLWDLMVTSHEILDEVYQLKEKMGIEDRDSETFEYREELSEIVYQKRVEKLLEEYESLISSFTFSKELQRVVRQGELAAMAKEEEWVRPQILPKEENCLEIEDALFIPFRHGNEFNLDGDTAYVKNSTSLNQDTRIEILEGPNNGGKTTEIKKTLMTAIMALSGSYVPATSAKISIRDRIILRAKGEGKELSAMQQDCENINDVLPKENEYSLIGLDETFMSTENEGGLYLTAGTLKTIAEQEKSLVVVSSHYTTLEDILGNKAPYTFNRLPFKIGTDGSVSFTFKKTNEPISSSYAIKVAEYFNFSSEVIKYAKEKLS